MRDSPLLLADLLARSTRSWLLPGSSGAQHVGPGGHQGRDTPKNLSTLISANPHGGHG